MELTPQAQQSLDFSTACFLQGMCTHRELLKAVGKIYQDDVKKQVEFLIEQGFSQLGAFKHVYNVDSGEDII